MVVVVAIRSLMMISRCDTSINRGGILNYLAYFENGPSSMRFLIFETVLSLCHPLVFSIPVLSCKMCEAMLGSCYQFSSNPIFVKCKFYLLVCVPVYFFISIREFSCHPPSFVTKNVMLNPENQMRSGRRVRSVNRTLKRES